METLIQPYKHFTIDALPHWLKLDERPGLSEATLLNQIMPQMFLSKVQLIPQTARYIVRSDLGGVVEAMQSVMISHGKPGAVTIDTSVWRTIENIKLVSSTFGTHPFLSIVPNNDSHEDMTQPFNELTAEEIAALATYTLGSKPRREVIPAQTEKNIKAKLKMVAIAPAFSVDAMMSALRAAQLDVVTSKNISGVVLAVSRLHNAIVHMHPMADNNGRLARALANTYLLSTGLPPVITKCKGYSEAVEADMADPETIDQDPKHPKVSARAVAELFCKNLKDTMTKKTCWECVKFGGHRCNVCHLASFCSDCANSPCANAH